MLNYIFSIYVISRWKNILIWSVSMFILALVFAGLYDSFKGEITDMIGNAPKLMEAMIGPISEDAVTPEIWLGIELYGLLFPILLAVIAVSAGASAIGTEEESGTIELILASPISRGRVVLEKSLGIMIQLGIVSGFLWVGIATGSLLFPFDVSLTNVFSATAMGWIFGTTVAYITMSIQSLKGRKGLALGVGSGFVGLSYVMMVISGLLNGLNSLKYTSLFNYYDGRSVLINGLNETSFAVMLGLSGLFLIVSLYGFYNRDVGI
jgi:ABC-2 type transport system permease protein|tara:strand:- start:1183 stop:1977 length:795 start_codon:yes stop_codon:yes gene_type:complete